MIDWKGLLDGAVARYADRTSDRGQKEKELSKGKVSAANEIERVIQRLIRLGMSEIAAARLAEGKESLETMVEEGDVPDATLLGLERILHKNDLIDVSFLELGALTARSVGRIVIRSASGSRKGFGTCFLVSPRVLMTNNHVLGDATEAAHSAIQFNFQEDVHDRSLEPVTFRLDPQGFFITNKELDYTMVAVQPVSLSNRQLGNFGWLPLTADQGTIVVGEHVNIIQHPSGRAKQMAIRQNKVVDILDKFMHYETDTEPGSSGAPVMNDQWELVALHHSGVPKTNKAGDFVAKNGKVWKKSMGADQLAFVANEGVRISVILSDLQEQVSQESTQEAFVDEILQGSKNPPNLGVVAAAAIGRFVPDQLRLTESPSGAGVEARDEGDLSDHVELNIPIRIRLSDAIRLRNPAPASVHDARVTQGASAGERRERSQEPSEDGVEDEFTTRGNVVRPK